jgi:hypothetical protein
MAEAKCWQWSVVRGTDIPRTIFVECDEDGEVDIATMSNNLSTAECKRYAKQIAAAPALLEACKAARKRLEQAHQTNYHGLDGSAYELCCAAIAGGKTNGAMKAVGRLPSWRGSTFDDGKTGEMKRSRGGTRKLAASGSGIKNNKSFNEAVCLRVS